MATWAQLKAKVIDLYQDEKLIPYVNIFRWASGSQSDGTLFSVIWKTRKLDFHLTHAKLYGPNGLIDEIDADMSGFVSTLTAAMPFPEDNPDPETSTLDDAYDDLLEIGANERTT